MGVGGGLGRSRLIEGCRNKVERCTVYSVNLALQVYKTICNNIFKLGNLLHSMREVVEYFFTLCPRKQRHTSHRCSTCMTHRRHCFTRPSSVVNGL